MKAKYYATLFLALLFLSSPLLGQELDELNELSGLAETQIEQTTPDEPDDLSALSDDPVDQTTMNELSDLSDEGSSDDLSALSAEGEELTESDDDSSEVEDDTPSVSLSFGGYVKPLAYWRTTNYSDTLWKGYQGLAAKGFKAPNKQTKEEFTDVGIRTQLKLEGYLGDQARLFTAFNINYNETAENEEERAKIKLIESYIELFEGSRTWKIGNQLMTWGFMEGIEVPTDRLNARDYSFSSMEYEDSKLASTGILVNQSLGDFSFLEFIYIPKAKVNKNADYADYAYTLDDMHPESYYGKGKYAMRLFFNMGNLDGAIHYIDGLDPVADVNIRSGQYQKSYHRVKSPGLDLQYNFGGFLAKLAAVHNITEDGEGDDPYIKNSWSKMLAGVEFVASSVTTNIYIGQTSIHDYQEKNAIDTATNTLMGQQRENVRFISGHVNTSFLTGNALDVTVMFANYWDEEESFQRILSSTFTYKLSDGLEAAFSPGYIYFDETEFATFKSEITYNF